MRYVVLERLCGTLCNQRGQAMVEYSTLTFALLIGSGVVLFTTPLNGQTNMIAALFAALQSYVDSMYYCLSLGMA
jgi:hypothetical protein